MAEYKAIHGTLFQHKTSDPLDTGLPGATWSSGGNMNTARRTLGGTGTQTAGLAFGGYTATANTNSTEEYDGSSWTAGGNMGTTRRQLTGAGTQTAGLAFGGEGPPRLAATEEYGGSSWTAGGNLGTARKIM